MAWSVIGNLLMLCIAIRHWPQHTLTSRLIKYIFKIQYIIVKAQVIPEIRYRLGRYCQQTEQNPPIYALVQP